MSDIHTKLLMTRAVNSMSEHVDEAFLMAQLAPRSDSVSVNHFMRDLREALEEAHKCLTDLKDLRNVY